MTNLNPYEAPRAPVAPPFSFAPNQLPVVLRPPPIWSNHSAIFCGVFAFIFALQFYSSMHHSNLFSVIFAAISFSLFLYTIWLWVRVSQARIEISSVGINANWPHAVFAWSDVVSWREDRHSSITVTLQNGRQMDVTGPAAGGEGDILIRAAMEYFHTKQ